MKFLSLSVENFAGLPERTFSFAMRTGGAARAVLVVGGPAIGRLLTSVIAPNEHIAPYGKRLSLASGERQPGRDVVIQTTCNVVKTGASP